MTKMISLVRTMCVTAIVSLLAQSVWAAVKVGDTVTWSNANTERAVKTDSNVANGHFSLCIPATDDLPAGSIVKITNIKFASVNSSWTAKWDAGTADAYALKLNNVQSGWANGATAANQCALNDTIQSNSTTADKVLSYTFSNCPIEVGKTYAAGSSNTIGAGIATLYSNNNYYYSGGNQCCTVRHVAAADTDVITDTTSGYNPVYEITAQVVSFPEEYAYPGKKTISVNFNAATAAATVPDSPATYGLVAVPGSAWKNLTGTSGTNVSGLKSYDGTTTEEISGMTMTYSSNGSWHNDAATAPFMKYYLDIGTGANQVVNINIAGIPFTKYDVVIYTNYSTDTNPTTMWRAFKVNGTWYSVPSDSTDGVATEVEDSDAATTYWGGCNVAPTWGVNAMRVTNVSGTSLSILGQNNNYGHRYGSVSAIQILEREDTAQYKDVTWDGSNWKCGDETIAALDSLCRVHLKDTDSVAFVADQVPFSIELPDSGEVTMSNTGNLGDFMINIPAATTLKLANKAGDNVGFVGAGTLKIGGTATDTKDNLQSWIANANVSGFSGTLYLNAGRFETNFVLAKNVKIRIPDGAQLSTGGSGEWNNHFIISGNGWTGELNNYRALSECAIRLENNLGDDAIIETVADGDKIPKVGNWNSDIQIKGKLKGSCDIAFGSFNAMHTYTFTRPHITTEFTGKVLQHNSKGKLKLTMNNNTTAAFGSAIACPVEVSVAANQTATLKTEITGTEGLTKTLWGTLELVNGSTGYQVNGGKVTVSQGTLKLCLGNGDAKIKDATFVIAARTNAGDTIKLDNYGWVWVDGTLTIENADETSVLNGTCFRPSSEGAALKIVKKGAGALTFNSWYAVGSSAADFPNTCSIEVNGGKLTIPQRDSLVIHSPITLKDADAKFYSAATVDSVTTDVANKTVKQDADGVYCVVDLVEIAIPIIDHATASVVDGDGNAVVITDNKIKVADGTALTVTYTVNETNYVGGGAVELTATTGSTVDTSTIATPAIRSAGTIYSNAKNFSSFKIGDKVVTPITGDVIAIADGYNVSRSDRWAINLSDAPAGYTIQIAYLDNGTDPGVSVYGVPANMNIEIVENCRLYMQGDRSVENGATIEGEGYFWVNDNTVTINGNVSITSLVDFKPNGTGVIKLNDNSTLTVASELAAGKVVSAVESKKAVPAENEDGTVTYSLETKTYTLTITPVANTTVTVDGAASTAASITVDYGTDHTIVYTADTNYKLSGEGSFTLTNVTADTTVGAGLSAVLDVTTITIPEAPANTTVKVTVDGTEATPVDGAITATIGAKVVVTYTANEGYLPAETKTEFTAGSTTEITVPSDVHPIPPVAKIGTVEYISLQEAFTVAAEATDTVKTITLISDVTTDDLTLVMKAKNVILDLDGHVLTANIAVTSETNSNLVFTIKNPIAKTTGKIVGDIAVTNCKLTVSGSSSQMVTVEGSITTTNSSDTTIQGKVVQADETKAAITVNGGLVKITADATIDATKAIYATAGKVQVSSNSGVKSATIGGTVVAAEGVTMALNGGKYTSEPNAAFVAADKVVAATEDGAYVIIAKPSVMPTNPTVDEKGDLVITKPTGVSTIEVTDAEGIIGSTVPLKETGLYTVTAKDANGKTVSESQIGVIAAKDAEDSSDAKVTTAVAVPFTGATVKNLLNTALLSNGDTLMAYITVGTKSGYAKWTLTGGEWVGTGITGGIAAQPATTALKRGSAVWVTTAGKVVVLGKYDTTTEIAAPTAKETHLFANPTMGEYTPVAVETDEVVIINEEVETDVIKNRYNKTATGWERHTFKKVANPFGGSAFGSKEIIDTTAPSVPVGKGFWFIKK